MQADPDNPENVGTQEYRLQNAQVLTYVMTQLTEEIQTKHQFIQTYSLKTGIKKFGKKGVATADR